LPDKLPQLKTSYSLKIACLLCAMMFTAAAKAQFQYRVNGGAIAITKYTGSGGSVVIPSTINGLPVTSIGNSAFFDFFDKSRVTSIIIPDSVTTIGTGAFQFCTSLTNVTMGSSIKFININAFYKCDRLTTVNFRGNAPFGLSEFSGDNNLTVYYLPNTTGWRQRLDGRPAVLWNPPVPYNYTVNNGTITITGYTGSGGAISLPITIDFLPVTSISDWAFYNCTSLTSVTIPNSVTRIGTGAFDYCFGLTNVTIPDGITSIGDETFNFCTSLTGLTIPDSVTRIGNFAFNSCYSLINLTIGNSVNSIGNYAFNSTSLTNVIIPNSVSSIGMYAFVSCTSLTNIIIGDSVNRIGDFAFYCTSLTSVIIPNTVTSIGDQTFGECPNLTSVYFLGDAPSFASTVFIDDNNLTVYYFSGTTGWGATFGGFPTVPY